MQGLHRRPRGGIDFDGPPGPQGIQLPAPAQQASVLSPLLLELAQALGTRGWPPRYCSVRFDAALGYHAVDSPGLVQN